MSRPRVTAQQMCYTHVLYGYLAPGVPTLSGRGHWLAETLGNLLKESPP